MLLFKLGEVMKTIIKSLNKPLLILTVILASLGLLMIFSASSVAAVLRYNVTTYHFFVRQLFFVTGSFLVGFLVIISMPTANYKRFLPLAMVFMFLSLVAVLIYGKVAGGAQSWLKFGRFSLQPSEFAKAILIVYMAIFYNEYRHSKSPFAIFKPIGLAMIVAILTAMQPDFGGAAIIAGLVFLIFISVPIQKDLKAKAFKFLGYGIALAVGIVLYSGTNLLNSTQLKRFNFQNPCSRYTESTGYQVCNGYIAINNGGLLGSGLGNSSQKYLYLPEAHTDFIFAIIVEELGLITGILIILAYMYMLFLIYRIAREASNMRNALIAYGTMILITIHIFINLLGALALLPLTGVPLPLLSYGGSFNSVIIILLFMVQRVSIENNEAKYRKQIQNI